MKKKTKPARKPNRRPVNIRPPYGTLAIDKQIARILRRKAAVQEAALDDYHPATGLGKMYRALKPITSPLLHAMVPHDILVAWIPLGCGRTQAALRWALCKVGAEVVRGRLVADMPILYIANRLLHSQIKEHCDHLGLDCTLSDLRRHPSRKYHGVWVTSKPQHVDPARFGAVVFDADAAEGTFADPRGEEWFNRAPLPAVRLQLRSYSHFRILTPAMVQAEQSVTRLQVLLDQIRPKS